MGGFFTLLVSAPEISGPIKGPGGTSSGKPKDYLVTIDTWDNKTFATRTNSEFVNQPVLHIALIDLWDTS